MSAQPVQVKEVPGQKTWVDHGLHDLRSLPRELRATAPSEIEAAVDVDAAVEVLANVFGLADPQFDRIAHNTPVGYVTVLRDKLVHIVEKRADARERYARYALQTLQDPFEVWSVSYDNGGQRNAYIGVFEARRQMLVVVETFDGEVLWNFMHTDAKSLNKHRHGIPIYRRPIPES